MPTPIRALHRHPLTLALLGVAATLLFFFAVNPAFFFVDDRVAQYFPYGLVIKDMLSRGAFPFVTTRTLYGGALWADWQYAIYNPVSLALTFAIMPRHLGISGLIYALAFNLLLTTGAFRVGRSYGLGAPLAALFGLLMGINIEVVYIGSSDWIPAVASLAWLMFAWAALKDLLRAERDIARHVLLAAVFVWLMFTSGWPHSDVAFCIIAAAVCAEELRSLRGFLRLGAAAGLSAALCVPALVPVLASLNWMDHIEVKGAEKIMTPTLLDLLNISNPAWRPQMRPWLGESAAPLPPLFMAGWFALPALAFIRWRAVRWKDQAGLLVLVALFGLLACGIPENQHLNFPFRWLPEVHALFLLVLLRALQAPALSEFSTARLKSALAIAAGLAVLAYAADPDLRRFALFVIPVAFVPLLLYPESRGGLALCLGATSLATALAIGQAYPFNLLFIPWQKATTTIETPAPAREDRIDYTLFEGWPRLYGKLPPGPPDLAREAEFPMSAMPVYYHIDSINGYSSIVHEGMQRVFGCKESRGTPCTIIPLKPMMRRELATGQRYLDLFKIDRIVTDDKNSEQEVARALPGWARSPRDTTVSFDRPAKTALPGTMSWHSPGLSTGSGGTYPDGEYATVKNGPAPGLITYARLYYPGFRASLDRQALGVHPVNGLLVGVDIPPNASGRLDLAFRPPCLGPSIAAAIAGLVLWAFGALVERRRNRQAQASS